MAKNKIEGESQEEKKILNKSLQALRHLVQTLDAIKNEDYEPHNFEEEELEEDDYYYEDDK